jgi:hypothetical protein
MTHILVVDNDPDARMLLAACDAAHRSSLLSAVRTCQAQSVVRPIKAARSIEPSPDDPRPP